MKTIIIAIVLTLTATLTAGSLAPNHYYTWSIPEPNIPNGSIITSVDITLSELEGRVYVWLVDNPPIGWIKNIGTMERDTYIGQAVTERTISLSAVILAESWTHKIFPQPFQMSIPAEGGGTEEVLMNAALLEYIDYTGNGTPSGLLLYGEAELSSISVAITVRSFVGEYYREVFVYSVPVPVDLAVIEAWADAERVKLMHEYMEKMEELEVRIAERLEN